MSEQEKKEKHKEYKERFVRWQQLSINQMSFTNNLFLGFDIGFLSFLVFQTGMKFTEICWLCSFQIISLLCLIGSFITGTMAVMNRLNDFRYTKTLVSNRKKKYEKNHKPEGDTENSVTEIEDINFEIEWYELLTRKLGKRTWRLLNWQIWTFAIGVVIGILYLIIYKNLDV